MTQQINPSSLSASNRRILSEKQPPARKGIGCTIVGLFHKHPATIVLVGPRRMLVQEDLVQGADFLRNEKGVIRGFVRRAGSHKWRYAGGEVGLDIYVGKRIYQPPPRIL